MVWSNLRRHVEDANGEPLVENVRARLEIIPRYQHRLNYVKLCSSWLSIRQLARFHILPDPRQVQPHRFASGYIACLLQVQVLQRNLAQYC